MMLVGDNIRAAKKERSNMLGTRQPISDEVVGALKEEVVYVCPLGLSDACDGFEKIETPFTNHHIDLDPSHSDYWNLIRICEPCHKEHNRRGQDGDLQRKIKLRKKNLALQYFGPLAVNVLRMAYKYGTTSAMPSMVMRLIEKGYLRVHNQNPFTVGTANHVTLQDYAITDNGRKLIENLIGPSNLPTSTFSP